MSLKHSIPMATETRMHICLFVHVHVFVEFCPKVFTLSGHVCMCVPDMCINTPTEQQQKEQVFSFGAATP